MNTTDITTISIRATIVNTNASALTTDTTTVLNYIITTCTTTVTTTVTTAVTTADTHLQPDPV